MELFKERFEYELDDEEIKGIKEELWIVVLIKVIEKEGIDIFV